MELWQLGAGAIVLIGIAAWLVWPTPSIDAVGTQVQQKEDGEESMTDTPLSGSALPPQGDAFEDQYTSATADLSAGGVAAAFEAMQDKPAEAMQDEPLNAILAAAPEAPGQPSVPEAPAQPSAPQAPVQPSVPSFSSTPPWTPPTDDNRSGPEPGKIGLGAAIVLALVGAVGGAWLYARWQRERNKPINRLRRSARDIGSRLGERIPEVDDLPQSAAPLSGAAAALLLAGLVALRALRRDGDEPAQQVRDVVQDAAEKGRKAARRGRDAAERGGRDPLERGRETSKQARAAADSQNVQEVADLAWQRARQGRKVLEEGSREAVKRGREAASRSARDVQSRIDSEALTPSGKSRVGIGAGTAAALAGGAYLVWRLTHREPPPEPRPWYAGVQS